MRHTFLMTVAIALSCSPAWAQVYDRKDPSVATASDGSYVIVWADDSAKDIFARRYDKYGKTQGAAFQVSTSIGEHKKPIVSMASDGSFVVVWEKKVSDNVKNVFARRYDASGNALGGEFQVNTSGGEHKSPSIAVESNGDFVIVWENKISDTVKNVLGQRYSSNGNTKGTQFQVNQTSGEHKEPRISMADDGSFVVSWEYKVSDTVKNVLTRRYKSNGQADGNEFQVNTSSGEMKEPSIAVAADGSFVVAWNNDDDENIYFQRYNSSGIAQGGEIKVNQSSGEMKDPSIAVAADGSFVIVWENDDNEDIYARRYDASGNALAGEFRVNTTTSGEQKKPAVAVAPGGTFVVVWEDKATKEISGQRFDVSGNPAGSEFSANDAGGVRVLNWTEVPNRAGP